MRQTHYFDYNATTPLDRGVAEIMTEVMTGIYGNPSSVHHVGQDARFRLDECRDRVAQAWKCKPSEVVFTSGGTESNNLALFGVARMLKEKGKHIIISTIEHHAVLNAINYLEKQEGFEITRVEVNQDGLIDPEDVQSAIRPDTILVSVMAANNETGAIQPVADIGTICSEHGILFHTDAVQWFGKLEFESIHDFKADLVSICGHKFHGPKGSGALFIKSPLLPHPVLFGGAHENERRAGTENLAAIVGLTEAIERFTRCPVFKGAQYSKWKNRILDSLSAIDGVSIRSPQEKCLENTLAFTVDGSDGMILVANFDLKGICVSSGSACSAGSIEPSHVIRALGATDAESKALVRLSFGRENVDSEIETLTQSLGEIIQLSRN